MVGLLIKEYIDQQDNISEPIDVINAKKDWINEDKNIIDSFKNDFELTGNKDDFVTSKVIEEWIKSNNLGITMKKFGMEMKKYLTVHKIDGIMSDNKKLSGKVIKVWFGIKIMCNDNEE